MRFVYVREGEIVGVCVRVGVGVCDCVSVCLCVLFCSCACDLLEDLCLGGGLTWIGGHRAAEPAHSECGAGVSALSSCASCNTSPGLCQRLRLDVRVTNLRVTSAPGRRYCKDARLAFESMSNSVQMLAAVRAELTRFLARATTSPPPAPAPPSDAPRAGKRCYGCASCFVTHGLELVNGLVQRAACRRLILEAGLLQELIRSNIHAGPPASRRQARAVVCLLVRDDAALTEVRVRGGSGTRVAVRRRRRSRAEANELRGS